MTTTILAAGARLDDPTAMDALIAPLPNGEQLRQKLRQSLLTRTPMRTKAYHEETRTARYVVSDGEHVVCFTVTDVTLEQATAIAAECSAMTVWDLPEFHAAAARALGAPFDLVQ